MIMFGFTYFSVQCVELTTSSEDKMFPLIKQDFDSEKLKRQHTEELFMAEVAAQFNELKYVISNT